MMEGRGEEPENRLAFLPRSERSLLPPSFPLRFTLTFKFRIDCIDFRTICVVGADSPDICEKVSSYPPGL